MIRERILYKEELPVNVLVSEIEEYPFHFHNEMEIIYVLEGKISLKCSAYTYSLRAGDAFVINVNEPHEITSNGEENMVMLLHISTKYFEEYYNNLADSFFMIDPEKELPKESELVKKLIGKIMLEILQKGYGYEEKVIETVHNLLVILLSDFKYSISEDGRLVGGVVKSDRILAARLCKIISQMCCEYYKKLTLNSIAEDENLSIFYLSHIIKDAIGLSFQEFLNYIRVEESEFLLKSTDKKISLIATETGFSAVRYYIKHFESWYGISPSDYRGKYGDKGCPKICNFKCARSDSSKIEIALKKLHADLYREYLSIRKCLPIIVDVDLSKAFSAEGKENFAARVVDSRELMKPITRPYKLLKSLRENVRERGLNYIVTADTEIGECEKCMSVLVYNFNAAMCAEFSLANTKEKMLEKIEAYNENGEFLIRISGLSGDFRISRYKLSRENIKCAYEELINHQNIKNINVGKRQAIVSNWSTLPDISFDNVQVMGNLSIRSTLKGVSGELILIDRVSY